MRKNRLKENKFAFDFVFDKGVGTRQIYESTVEGLLEGVMDGFHSTVLAYGPTSCGKTYTYSQFNAGWWGKAINSQE